MNTEATAALALTLCPGTGSGTVRDAMAVASNVGRSLHELVNLPARELVDLLPQGAGETAYALSQCTDEHLERASYVIQRLETSGGRTLVTTDAAYPRALKVHLERNTPPLLFVYGDAESLHVPSAAIVGARRPSDHGILLAQQCASTFAAQGIPVVSGGAEGIDSAAHSAALDAGGTTLVILPQGLLTYKASREVTSAREQGHLTLVSEFAPDAPWTVHGAVTRNATISALARVVCVIEPKKTGGSIRTARIALAQGKKVFVHVAKEHMGALRGLLGAGALPLLDDSGVFSREDLWAHWESAPNSEPRQHELF